MYAIGQDERRFSLHNHSTCDNRKSRSQYLIVIWKREKGLISVTFARLFERNTVKPALSDHMTSHVPSYTETCPCGHLYSKTHLVLSQKCLYHTFQPSLRDHLHFFLARVMLAIPLKMVTRSSLVPRPYFQFVGPGLKLCNSVVIEAQLITFLRVAARCECSSS
jgi:hypothetical protein